MAYFAGAFVALTSNSTICSNPSLPHSPNLKYSRLAKGKSRGLRRKRTNSPFNNRGKMSVNFIVVSSIKRRVNLRRREPPEATGSLGSVQQPRPSLRRIRSPSRPNRSGRFPSTPNQGKRRKKSRRFAARTPLRRLFASPGVVCRFNKH